MSDCTELFVTFKTTNTNPLQELKGIFNNYWDTVLVSQYDMGYAVRIHELSLLESLSIIKNVQEHCKRNHREITIEVKYGVIHSYLLERLKC
jgi:hypothetical protein